MKNLSCAAVLFARFTFECMHVFVRVCLMGNSGNLECLFEPACDLHFVNKCEWDSEGHWSIAGKLICITAAAHSKLQPPTVSLLQQK